MSRDHRWRETDRLSEPSFALVRVVMDFYYEEPSLPHVAAGLSAMRFQKSSSEQFQRGNYCTPGN